MFSDEPNFMPYAPGNRVVEVLRRIHEGRTPPTLTDTALVSLGVPEGNADRVQKALRFLNLLTPEFTLTPEAVALRRATSEEYGSVLGNLVRGAYEPIFHGYEPATATDLDLNNAFKPYDPAGQRSQMIALFMSLSREAGLAPGDPIRKRGRRPGTTLKPKDGRERKTPPTVTPGAENGAPRRGTTRTVGLRDSSGSVTVTVSADLWELDGENRDFVLFLMDVVKAWERGESGGIWARAVDIT
jgi:hypothetical protein